MVQHGMRFTNQPLAAEGKGAGVDPEDPPSISDPFYRVRFAREEQLQRAGPRLNHTRDTMESIGGRNHSGQQTGRG